MTVTLKAKSWAGRKRVKTLSFAFTAIWNFVCEKDVGGKGIFIMYEGLGVIYVRGVSLMWCTTKTCKKIHMYIFFLYMIHKWAHDVALEGLGGIVCLCLKKQKKTSLMRLEWFLMSFETWTTLLFLLSLFKENNKLHFLILKASGVFWCRTLFSLCVVLGLLSFFVFYIWTRTGFYLFIFNVEKYVYPFQWTAPM